MKRFLLTVRRSFSTILSRVFSAARSDEGIDASRIAESLLPVSQLYGFEMSDYRTREIYEK